MSEIRIVNDSGQITPPPVATPLTSKTIDSPVLEEMELRSIGAVLGLEKDSEIHQNQNKIRTLLSYAKSQTEDHSPENLKWVIRSLELKLGTPPFAEKRINWLSRYAYLLSEESKIKKEKQAFEQI